MASLSSFSNHYKIDPASWRDLNSIRLLEQVCFPKDAWPLWDLIGVLTLPNVVRLKAVDGDKLIGFIAGDIRPAEKTSYIATVGVLPEYRNQGIGAALLLACESRLPTPAVKLNVRITNRSAIRLYQDHGYQRVGVWPAYYTDREDALVMEKSLR